ncbi:MAG: hypothetical protein ACJ74Y_07170 [Bryobacteraceae bacterium]
MRGIEKLLVIAFLVLAALGLWKIRVWLTERVASSVASLSSTPKPAARIVGSNTAKPPASGNKRAAKARPNEATLQVEGLTIVDVPYSDRPFPEPKDLSDGMTASEIRAAYGEPAAHVAGSYSGQLIEKYYYVDREHSRYTIANLQDGRLISASSRPL